MPNGASQPSSTGTDGESPSVTGLSTSFGYDTNRAELADSGALSRGVYAEGSPFPHIVIDHFFDESILRAVSAEIDGLDRSKRYAKFLDRKTDHNKYAFYPEAVGPDTARLAQWLNSGAFLSYLEELTGIANLIPDPSYFGGGLHWIDNGGYLEIHADFNHLKRYNLERRINLLLYLNEDWRPEYNGDLELWDRATMTRAKSVTPVFNRAVIFSTTKDALHGHPTPVSAPEGRSRRSLALYYYTNTWEPLSHPHSTLFFVSQNHQVRIRPSRIIKGLVLDLIPPIFRKSVKAIKRAIKGEKLGELWM